MEAGVGVVGAGACALGLYRALRPLLPTTVNCHFCCQDTQVPYPAPLTFTCPHCHQSNGWDSEGDALVPPPTTPPVSYTRAARPAAPSANGLCRSCNLNQELKIAALGKAQGEGEEVEQYADHLERAYRLCAACEEVVAARLRRQDALLAPSVLHHRLERSRLERSARSREGGRLPATLAALQLLLASLLAVLATEQAGLVDRLAASHPALEGLYLLSDALCLLIPTSPLLAPALLSLLLLVHLLHRHFHSSTPPTTPRCSSFLPPPSLAPEGRPEDTLSQALGDLHSWSGDSASPTSPGNFLPSPKSPPSLFSSPISPPHLFSTPATSPAHIFSSTPSSSPLQPLKSRDEVTINHEFALDASAGDGSDSDCGLSVLSLGHAPRSPSPRGGFLMGEQYSARPTALALFSPRRPLLRPSRLTSSWVAGGYWTPPSQAPVTPSRASSQSSGFISATPSLAFPPSQPGSVLNFPSHPPSPPRPESDRFSLSSELLPSVPSPPPTNAFSQPRRPTLDDCVSESSLLSQGRLTREASRAATPAPGAKAWTLTLTITPAHLLLALSVAANVALVVLWGRQE